MTEVIKPAELYRVMRQAYDELIAFVSTAPFRELHAELYELPSARRPKFVRDVLLNADALSSRGVELPEGVLIQRSSFGDQRPTLFCVKKFLPKECWQYWQNVNLTFDNEFDDSSIPRDEQAWQKPLPVDVQSLLIENGVTAKEIGIA